MHNSAFAFDDNTACKATSSVMDTEPIDEKAMRDLLIYADGAVNAIERSRVSQGGSAAIMDMTEKRRTTLIGLAISYCRKAPANSFRVELESAYIGMLSLQRSFGQ